MIVMKLHNSSSNDLHNLIPFPFFMNKGVCFFLKRCTVLSPSSEHLCTILFQGSVVVILGVIFIDATPLLGSKGVYCFFFFPWAR